MTGKNSDVDVVLNTIRQTYSRVTTSQWDMEIMRERVMETLNRIHATQAMIRSSDSFLRRVSPRDI